MVLQIDGRISHQHHFPQVFIGVQMILGSVCRRFNVTDDTPVTSLKQFGFHKRENGYFVTKWDATAGKRADASAMLTTSLILHGMEQFCRRPYVIRDSSGHPRHSS